MADEISSDGSPVEAYAALPAEPELSAVLAIVDGRHSILDLGCGTGRIADPLSDAGHEVVAVDDSAEMLVKVRSARVVHSSIEHLDLGRSFDAVLMLSHLVNGEKAPELLRAAARHLRHGGVLVIQRLQRGRSWQPGSVQLGPVRIELDDVALDGQRISATTTYVLGDRSWRQPWVMWEWTDEQLADLLRAAGLTIVTTDGIWLTATR